MLKFAALWIAFGQDINALASEDFVVREAAEARLTRWADVCWPLLDRPFGDLEQHRRAQRVLRAAWPRSFPPIALLAGSPLPEWSLYHNDNYIYRVGSWPGPRYILTWMKPARQHMLRLVVLMYGSAACTQYEWKEWHSDRDGREATRLLCRHLLTAGAPSPLVRRLVEWMQAKEDAL